MLIILSALLLFRPAYDVSVFHSFSFGSRVAGREGQTLVMFWNLENLFDWRRDSLNGSESEAEFTSFGKKHWTKRRFTAKCNAIAKSIFWIKDRGGRASRRYRNRRGGKPFCSQKAFGGHASLQDRLRDRAF